MRERFPARYCEDHETIENKALPIEAPMLIIEGAVGNTSYLSTCIIL